MSTTFRHVNRYPASPAEVRAMLTAAEFREEVCTSQEALDHSVEVSTTGGTTTVVVTQSQSTEGAPTAARKVVGDAVRIVQREEWVSADAEPLTAGLSMEVPGKPGQLKGRISLVDQGDGTTEERFEGEVKVNIPLVGGKLEKFIADLLARGLRREGRVGVRWLEDRSG